MTTAPDEAVSCDGLALLRLLQLASPGLPIGAFAYSQGLESAVAVGIVTDEVSACAWITGLLAGPVTSLDLAVFVRLHAAFVAGDRTAAECWNELLLASRATAELQAEDRHLGAALGRVLETLGVDEAVDPALAPGQRDVKPGHRRRPASGRPRSFAQMFALGTARWMIDVRPAAQAFAFAWAEAQVSAAVRLVPLGQSAGLRILAHVTRAIPPAVERALSLADSSVGGAAPAQALLSTFHETQYSRLFRS